MFCWKGNKLQVTVFGSSHGEEVGVEVQGFPLEYFHPDELSQFLARRKAKNDGISTARVEDDQPNFVSGVTDGVVRGVVKATIPNKNVHSGDYSELFARPRPSHADYAAHCMDGRYDFSGGGEFSGRMTAPLCVAGGLAKQMLEHRGITVFAYVSAVGKVHGASYKNSDTANAVLQEAFPSLTNGEKMIEEIRAAKQKGDSVGGRVDCVVSGMPAGKGGALFDGLEGKIAYLLYAIPAVKGVEFGSGFDLAEMTGSQANDPWHTDGKNITALTNNAGGLNGGVSNGMPITLSVAFRPTPSISLPQQTVDLITNENVAISVKGRHDACIVPRAVPVVEAMVSLALLDSIL